MEFQLSQLRSLIKHAYTNVPYYRRRFDARGVNPDKVRDVSDLHVLPYLTKQDIRDHLEDLVARNVAFSNLSIVTTSGTTSIPMKLYVDESVLKPTELAYITTLWNRVGYKFDDRSVVLRGVVPRNGMFEFDEVNNQLILSSFIMTDENLDLYVRLIRQFKPKFIQAYPSSMFILARFIEKKSLPPFRSVKALLLASEPIYPFQRKLMEEVLQCRVFSWYGHTEQAVLAGECECSQFYHLFSEYGVTELVGRDGESIAEEDEDGEIVATGFVNWAVPLIRYRTGDIGSYASEKCPCGRHYVLLKKVEGRVQELVVAADESLVPLGTAICAIHDAEWAMVKQIQFLQEKPGELLIRVVKDHNYAESRVRSYVLELLQKRLGKAFKLKVDVVKEIQRTRMGKNRYVVQKLPIDFVNHQNV